MMMIDIYQHADRNYQYSLFLASFSFGGCYAVFCKKWSVFNFLWNERTNPGCKQGKI